MSGRTYRWLAFFSVFYFIGKSLLLQYKDFQTRDDSSILVYSVIVGFLCALPVHFFLFGIRLWRYEWTKKLKALTTITVACTGLVLIHVCDAGRNGGRTVFDGECHLIPEFFIAVPHSFDWNEVPFNFTFEWSFVIMIWLLNLIMELRRRRPRANA